MLAIAIVLFIFALFCAAIVAISRRPSVYNDDDIITTTTTTTYTMGPMQDIVGALQRQWEGSQPFVIDPVDGDKVWLNTRDDMYEDGAGKVWRLA